MPTYTDRLKLANPETGECSWDDDWWRNQYIEDAVTTQLLEGNVVTVGGNLSGASGLQINIDQTTAIVSGVEYTTSAGTLTLTAGAADEDKHNWIYIDSAGVLQVSTTPPSGSFALVGMVDTNALAVVRTADLRADLVLHEPADDSVTQDKMAFNWDRKNVIINSDFDIWQRGISFSSNGLTADRWPTLSIGSTAIVSRQDFTLGQTDVPNNPKHFLRQVVSSVAGIGNLSILQYKSENVAKLQGETVTLSFWAKADSAKNIAIEYAQRFGLGGSPSPDVTGIGVETIPVTSTWQKFEKTVTLPSVSGKVLGTGGDDFLQLTFWFDAGSDWDARTNSLGQQSGTVDIAQVQFEEGEVATPHEKPSMAQEIVDCQRFFRKSYQLDVSPGTVTGLGMIQEKFNRNNANNMNGAVFANHMRTAPIVTIYSVALGTPGNVSNSGDKAAAAGNVGTQGFANVAITAGVLGSDATCHYTADAEL